MVDQRVAQKAGWLAGKSVVHSAFLMVVCLVLQLVDSSDETKAVDWELEMVVSLVLKSVGWKALLKVACSASKLVGC